MGLLDRLYGVRSEFASLPDAWFFFQAGPLHCGRPFTATASLPYTIWIAGYGNLCPWRNAREFTRVFAPPSGVTHWVKANSDEDQ